MKRRSPLALRPFLLLALPLAACAAQTDGGGRMRGGAEATSTNEQATTACGQTSVKGVDISHYDGTIDWTQAKAAGISFGFAKATEGTSFVDPTFATNWAAMKAAGVVRGAYHFFDAGVDPTQQAMHFLSVVTLEAGDLPPVLDFEASGSTLADATTFLAAVTQMTGVTAMIYTSPSFLSSYSGLGNYPLWVANWQVSCPDVPSPWAAYTFWQNSDSGTVAGISSAVDIDVYNGTLAQLMGSGSGSGSGSGGGSGSSTGSSSGSSLRRQQWIEQWLEQRWQLGWKQRVLGRIVERRRLGRKQRRRVR